MMRYHALACDFDGTIAWNGHVDEATIAALQRVGASGRALILVTGRELDELANHFPHLDLFDLVVTENGGVVYNPHTDEQRVLGELPPRTFIEALHNRGVGPISVGSVIVATWHPHEAVVLDTIEQLGLDFHVSFNKGAVMVLPAGITKATGLVSALRELRLSARNTVCVGDAENDQSMFRTCELAIAVNNALTTVKANADLVMSGHHGRGVIECIDQLISDDFASHRPPKQRLGVLVGRDHHEQPVTIDPFQTRMLVIGETGRGKSTLATGMIERLIAQGYQVCVVDPEGDYGTVEDIIHLGDSQRAPSVDEFLQLLASPVHSAVANLIGMPLSERPTFLTTLCHALAGLHERTGRPHWLVIDEAHHFFPADDDVTCLQALSNAPGLLLITVQPDHLAASILQTVNVVLTVDEHPLAVLQAVADQGIWEQPESTTDTLAAGEAMLWTLKPGSQPQRVHLTSCRSRHLRHRRKYAEGDLGWERSFYFRGPDHQLYPRAQNLITFMAIADEVDDVTWQFHAERHDYSRWMSGTIGDAGLAQEVIQIESAVDTPLLHRRHMLRRAIEDRYTLPA